VCNYCRPAGATTPPLGVLDLMAALRDGDWEAAEGAPQSARSQASGLVAAHLQWHLERQLRTLPLVERVRPGDPMDRMDRSLLDRRIALVRQDVAHGDEPGEPLRAEG
jgi:DNA repair protein RecO (recombination protein O)